MHESNLVDIKNLCVTFDTVRGPETVVRGVDLQMGREKLGIVGESGSGKSLTARAILGLIKKPGRVSADRMHFDDLDLLTLQQQEYRKIRGSRISMVMQDPKFSLNPVMSVGAQIDEAYRIQRTMKAAEAKEKTLEMLAAVKIRDPERVYRLYPHEVSGGMGQRIMIAMMLAPEPDLLIADEPTSALDVTVQLQVLDIMDEMVSRRNMGLIFISHDLNLVARFCHRILVMYAGRVVEACDAADLYRARHPYTQGLLKCLPSIETPCDVLPVLERDPAWLGF